MAGIYLHVPFCRSKCGYCAFNSRPPADEATLPRYLDALKAELAMRREALARLRVDTIYFGGGTPSLLAPDAIGELIALVKTHAQALGDELEITLEANPETLTATNLAGFMAAGVNRISLGAQSFDAEALAWLERRHAPERTGEAFSLAREAGYANIGLDLIVGLPHPHDLAYAADLKHAVELAPEHLSVYLLSAEEPSRLHTRVEKNEVTLLDEETQADIFLDCHEMLTDAGYEHYEVSNYARPGFRSRHNSAYWLGDAYLGFGAGAHSYYGLGARPQRWGNADEPDRYGRMLAEGNAPLAFIEDITATMAMQEKLMLQLRMSEGVDVSEFGPFADALREKLAAYADSGWYERDGDRFRPTAAGLLVADGVAADLWDVLSE